MGHFKEPFPPEAESQLLEVEDRDAAIIKERFILVQFKVESPQAISSSMLVHMIKMTDDAPETEMNPADVM